VESQAYICPMVVQYMAHKIKSDKKINMYFNALFISEKRLWHTISKLDLGSIIGIKS